MSNVYVHFPQISFPARYSVVKFQVKSHSLRFREVMYVSISVNNFNTLTYLQNYFKGSLDKTSLNHYEYIVIRLCSAFLKQMVSGTESTDKTFLFNLSPHFTFQVKECFKLVQIFLIYPGFDYL